MGSILVINAAGRETRVALVENGHIAEFYLERKKDKGVVGNLYKGRVVRVLPGMQAAFVDIGLDKAAFLYVSDVVYDPDFAREQFELTEGEHEEAPEVPEEPEGEAEEPAAQPSPSSDAPHDEDLEIRELAPGELPPPQGEPARTITGEQPAISSPPPPLAEAAEPPVLVAEQAPAPAVEQPSAPAAEQALAPVTEQAPTPATEQVPTPATEQALAPVAEQALAPVAEQKPAPAPAAPAEAGGVRGERRAGREMREQRVRDRERDRGRRGRDDRGRQRDREEEKAKPRKSDRIEDLLKVGQEVVVQISKDPIGTKGARLTSHISIPGRHLVFMPTVDHVGISRRISNEKERRRLRDIVERLRPPGTGFIVRTVAENVPQEKLESDIRFLIEVWNQVVRKNEKRGGPGLLHPDLDLILRATRDLFAHDVEKLVVDDREEYERVLGFVTAQDPALRDRVILHDNEEPIFDAYGIEQEINRAVQRKVWLKSGGYLIIDQAEALTAIDVNSGRYVGKKSLEETITKINVEAAKEIVYQLRLRNIGGIIICDFIDMEKSANRDKVFKTLQEALGRDKAKTNVLRISELGLVEMTRKRVRESIGRILHEDCSYCDGRGFVKTATTVCYEIFREIRREAVNYKDPTLVINCHPDVARLLQGEERQELRHLMDRYNKSIQVKAQQHYHREQYDVYGRSGQVDQRTANVGGESAGGIPTPPRRDEAPDPGRSREHRDRGGERGRDRGHGHRDRDRNSRDRRGPNGNQSRDHARGAPPQPGREPRPQQEPDTQPSGRVDAPPGTPDKPTEG